MKGLDEWQQGLNSFLYKLSPATKDFLAGCKQWPSCSFSIQKGMSHQYALVQGQLVACVAFLQGSPWMWSEFDCSRKQPQPAA